MTPLDERIARRRDLYLKHTTLKQTNIHAPGGIRTQNFSRQAAADLRLRPRGHWDRRMLLSSFKYTAHCRESTNDLSNVYTVFEESQTQSHWFSKNNWFTEILVNTTSYRTHGGPG